MTGQRYGGKKKGKKTKSQATGNESKDARVPIPDERDGQQFAIATKMLGGSRLMTKDEGGNERICHIPKAFKGRRYWISIGTLLMISIREFQQENTDVAYVYTSAEERLLKKWGKLEAFAKKDIENDVAIDNNEEEVFQFVQDDEDEVDLTKKSDYGDDMGEVVNRNFDEKLSKKKVDKTKQSIQTKDNESGDDGSDVDIDEL